VRIEGVDIVPLSEREKLPLRLRLGIVFQYAALFDYLTVFENVAFGLVRHRRLARAELERIVRERLAWVGLEGIEHLYPSQLSGGMRKRVGLARALALDPHIVLFDEPTSGLDPVNAYQIDTLIRRLNRELGLTAVIVSHDVVSVFRTADRVLMMNEGQILLEGTPETIQQADHPQVQAFLRMASAYLNS
jgi:phospholipid/cholesterol/gamma-HCH transport system ATP-binding protein